jgi:peroxiredoxin Q/BCP
MGKMMRKELPKQEKGGTMLATGKKAPEFALPDQDGKTHALSHYRGKWVVLFAFPKALTSG